MFCECACVSCLLRQTLFDKQPFHQTTFEFSLSISFLSYSHNIFFCLEALAINAPGSSKNSVFVK